MNGDVGQRLDVVDHGRAPVDPALGGERRPRRDGPAQALQAREQRGLLADHVGAGALHDVTSKSNPVPRMSLAEPAVGVGLLDRRVERSAWTAGTPSGMSMNPCSAPTA